MSDLRTRIVDDDPETRLAAVLEVGELSEVAGHAEAVEALVQRLWDDHPGIRQAALDMLGRLADGAGYAADERVITRALALVEDERPGVRAEAAASLALLAPDGDEARRIPALVRCLEDDASQVREQALAALGDLKATSAADAAAERLSDPDATVRFEAAFALAALQDARARAPLEATLAKTRRRLDALEGLRRLGDPAARPAIERLVGKWFLPWVDKLTGWAVLHALGDPEAGARVVARSGARRPEERTYALALIGRHRIAAGRAALERVAADGRDILQETAIQALGELGDAASRPVLARLADGADDDDVRALARQSLSRLDG